MTVRTAIIQLVDVDNSGNIVYKTNTIAKVIANLNKEQRVFVAQSGSAPNAANPGSTTAPTIHEYLNLEDGDGYSLVHLDNYYIITQN